MPVKRGTTHWLMFANDHFLASLAWVIALSTVFIFTSLAPKSHSLATCALVYVSSLTPWQRGLAVRFTRFSSDFLIHLGGSLDDQFASLILHFRVLGLCFKLLWFLASIWAIIIVILTECTLVPCRLRIAALVSVKTHSVFIYTQLTTMNCVVRSICLKSVFLSTPN